MVNEATAEVVDEFVGESEGAVDISGEGLISGESAGAIDVPRDVAYEVDGTVDVAVEGAVGDADEVVGIMAGAS